MPYKYDKETRELIQQPEMKEPRSWIYPVEAMDIFNHDLFVYKEHLASLKTYPIPEGIPIPDGWEERLINDDEFEIRNITIREMLKEFEATLTLDEQEELGYILDSDTVKDAEWKNKHYKINRSDFKRGLHIHFGYYRFFNDNEEYIGYEKDGVFVPDTKYVAIPKQQTQEKQESQDDIWEDAMSTALIHGNKVVMEKFTITRNKQ